MGPDIRKRRLLLGLNQREAADRLKANIATVLNWEKAYTEPPIDAVPAILQFLGYDPFPHPQTLQERMLAKRRSMGWSIKEAAQALGVDQCTWGDWERTGLVV